MNTRVRRSGGPGVLSTLALLAAGSLVVGLGCATTTLTSKPKPPGPPDVVVYRFKFTADPTGGLCTITQADVVFKNGQGKETPTDCNGNKKCGRASIPNGDSISFEETKDSDFASTPKPPSGKKVDFDLVFDPFKHGAVPGNQEKNLDKDLPGDSTGSKTYSFSVVAKGCKALDPIIVVDR